MTRPEAATGAYLTVAPAVVDALGGLTMKLIAVPPLVSAVRAWVSVTSEYPKAVPRSHRAACQELKAPEISSVPAERTVVAPSWQLAPIGEKLNCIWMRFCQAEADSGEPAT